MIFMRLKSFTAPQQCRRLVFLVRGYLSRWLACETLSCCWFQRGGIFNLFFFSFILSHSVLVVDGASRLFGIYRKYANTQQQKKKNFASSRWGGVVERPTKSLAEHSIWDMVIRWTNRDHENALLSHICNISTNFLGHYFNELLLHSPRARERWLNRSPSCVDSPMGANSKRRRSWGSCRST